jgi:Cd2+/Zn2+-exporting ATPase
MKAEMRTWEPNMQRMPSWIGKITPHLEWIAAAMSGVLIFAGWLFSNMDRESAAAASVVSFVAAYVIGGFAKAREGILDTVKHKKLNVELLMILAAIGSAVTGHWMEGAVLIFIFALSGALETYTMNRSRKELSALIELQPEEALRIRGGVEEKVPVRLLGVGDIVLIKPGERVPADGRVVMGRTYVDESALTGESLPVGKSVDDEVFAGTVNMRGTIRVEVTKPASETMFQKIIDLVQKAESEQSPSQQFIDRFEGHYVVGVLIGAVLMMFVPHFTLGWTWSESFYRAMVFLVIASPCAIVASVMPAVLSAISSGARRGILFKGGVHLETLGKVRAIAFDKTGTLTKGKPEVVDIFVREDLTEDELLSFAASIEQYSNHPLAQAIVQHAGRKGLDKREPEHMEDIDGFGVQGWINGSLWKLGKPDFVGRPEAERFLEQYVRKPAEADEGAHSSGGALSRGGARSRDRGEDRGEEGGISGLRGKTLVFVRDEKGIAGLITLQDTLREDALAALKELKKAGIRTIMLTGDDRASAEAIAEQCGISDVVAGCLPDRKAEELARLKERYGTVAMVGDGINDAPALASASIGIAMGAGTDAALQTADVVLMNNDLSRISEAIRLSRRMNRIVRQNIAFSLIVIALLMVSNFMQSLNLPMGVIGHEGSTLLVILNGLRLLRPMKPSGAVAETSQAIPGTVSNAHSDAIPGTVPGAAANANSVDNRDTTPAAFTDAATDAVEDAGSFPATGARPFPFTDAGIDAGKRVRNAAPAAGAAIVCACKHVTSCERLRACAFNSL